MTLFRRRLAAALTVMTPLMGGAGLTLRIALPAFADPPALGETVKMSRLGGFKYFQLPDGGRRMKDDALTQELTKRLRGYAAEGNLPLASTEIVAYDASEENAKGMLEATCQGAGMVYEEGVDNRFVARSMGDNPQFVVGYWTERDNLRLLVWGATAPKKEAGKALPFPAPVSDTPAADAPASVKETPQELGRKIAAPKSVVGGTWSWTTISSVNYVDKTTNRLQSPSGMSAKFSFRSGGGYEYFFYIRQQTYSLVSEATTTERGNATFFDNGTVLLTPTTGHYNGNTGSRLINRDMTVAERQPRTYYWEWRTEDGKRQLYIGPSRSALSRFKRS